MAAADTTPDDDDGDDDATGMGADDTDSAAADNQAGDADTGSDDNVICTIMCVPDQPGQYRLVKGDEDDSAGADEDQEGTTYKSEGLLLKAVLETLHDYEAEKSGSGSAQDNLMSGYGEDQPEPIQQKYNED